MITWNKVRKIAETNPWIVKVLEWTRHCDDKRPLPKRVKESIAFIAFRPFGGARPGWRGQNDFHPFFHESRMAGSDGVSYKSYPIVVFHYEGEPEYNLSELMSGSPATIEESMEWHTYEARERNAKIVFDAIVKPLVAKLNPHRMFAECYEIYRFPAKFDLEQWVSDKPREETQSQTR